MAQIFKDRGLRSGRIGIEERVRFFFYDGIRQAAPKLEYVSATPITAGCRMYKSPAAKQAKDSAQAKLTAAQQKLAAR